MMVPIFAIVVVIGALATILYHDPMDKLINLAVMTGGLVGLIVTQDFLDVAGILAAMLPISTIVTLMILIRMTEVVDKWI